MTFSIEQKNENILKRFESETSGTVIKKFNFTLDGKNLSMINMRNASLDDAIESLVGRWGERVGNVTEG